MMFTKLLQCNIWFGLRIVTWFYLALSLNFGLVLLASYVTVISLWSGEGGRGGGSLARFTQNSIVSTYDIAYVKNTKITLVHIRS